MSLLFDFISGANLQAPIYPTDGSVHTVPYSSPNTPLERQTPSHFVVDTQLLQKMQGRLQSYLATRVGERPVSNMLRKRLDLTQHSLAPTLAGPHMKNEATAAGFFWENIKPLVTDFVREVNNRAIYLLGADTAFGARPDDIWGSGSTLSSSPPGCCFIIWTRFWPLAMRTMGMARGWYSKQMRQVHAPSFSRYSFPISWFLPLSHSTCQIGISMSTKNFTWGIFTSSVISIFFHRHVAADTNGETHHIISCSDPVNVDSTHPSLFSLCAATLLGTQDPHALDTEPVSAEITLQPYTFFPAARPSNSTCFKVKALKQRVTSLFSKQSSSTAKPTGSTSTDIVALQMPHSCSQLGVQKVATLEYPVGVDGQCLWKVFLIYSILSHIILLLTQFSFSPVPYAPRSVCGIILAQQTSVACTRTPHCFPGTQFKG